MAANLGMLRNHFQRHNFDITVHAYQEMLNDDISVEMLVQVVAYDSPHVCEDYEFDTHRAIACCRCLSYN